MSPLRELHLFAGIGGGILGGLLLGHVPVCAVEIDPFCRRVLEARQRNGCLPPFPLHADVASFDGSAWRGKVDLVAGGFPCQDISCAGRRAGLDGKSSRLWFDMLRVVREAEPAYVFVENSPRLLVDGFDRVLGGLADLGFDAEWIVRSAADCGAPHRRKRLWILAAHPGRVAERRQPLVVSRSPVPSIAAGPCPPGAAGANTAGSGLTRDDQPDGEAIAGCEVSQRWHDVDGLRAPVSNTARLRRHEGGYALWSRQSNAARHGDHAGNANGEGLAERQDRAGHAREEDRASTVGAGWWAFEPNVGRVVDGVPARVDRLRTLGNAQVPTVARDAYLELSFRLGVA